MELTGDDWCVQIRSLLSACLGQITPNFRLISLRFTDGFWIVRFVLEAESEKDLEVVDEIYEDFGVIAWNAICSERTHGNASFSSAADKNTKKEVVISTNKIEREQEELLVWLYRRRENPLTTSNG